MRTFLSITLIGALAAAGCSSDDKTGDDTTTPPAATANSVTPANGFAGRQLRVQISGDNTSWTSTATVSMGDGITVGTVTVASPTDVFADITISPTAALGMRDVKVSDGGVDATLTQAFEIDSPVALSIQGTTAQGSIALFTLTNLDFDNPFDATSTGDGFTSPIVYTNFAITAGTGVAFNIGSVDAFSASGSVLFDLNAAAGAVTIASGPTGSVVNSPGEMLAVTARTPIALTAGTAATAMVTKAYDSALYELDVTTAVAALARFKAATTNANAAPEIFLLPSSGAWSDELDAGADLAEMISTTTKFYAIGIDPNGTAGFSYTVTGNSNPLTILDEVEPNSTSATAQVAATLPTLFTTATGAATLSTLTDEDWIKVTVPANKALHITTLAGDADCDTVIDVYKSDGTTLVIESDDQVYLDDVVTDPLTAGTYFVKISASQGGTFVAADNHYQALIYLD